MEEGAPACRLQGVRGVKSLPEPVRSRRRRGRSPARERTAESAVACRRRVLANGGGCPSVSDVRPAYRKRPSDRTPRSTSQAAPTGEPLEPFQASQLASSTCEDAAAAGDAVADGVRLLGEKAWVDEDRMLAAIDQGARDRRATFRLAVGKPPSVRACRRWVTHEDVVGELRGPMPPEDAHCSHCRVSVSLRSAARARVDHRQCPWPRTGVRARAYTEHNAGVVLGMAGQRGSSARGAFDDLGDGARVADEAEVRCVDLGRVPVRPLGHEAQPGRVDRLILAADHEP